MAIIVVVLIVVGLVLMRRKKPAPAPAPEMTSDAPPAESFDDSSAGPPNDR